MHIWVDADACPVAIKEMLYRIADRAKIHVVLVANRALRTPPSLWIRSIQVAHGFDVADDHIASAMAPGDLVVTADVPLAAAVVERGGYALNPRGEFYSHENVRELLDMRNFMDRLRASGVDTGGPPAFTHADRQAVANELDRFITRATRAGDTSRARS
jgi:uncharacterized protein YaiI (UPF0178 family)